jgi:hypothetical protein
VAAVAAGGAGRFLVLHLPQQRKLALFDANEGRVVHYFPVPEDRIAFAAGARKLMVGLPGAGAVQRWDLFTREREVTAPLPGGAGLSAMAMGSASNGPLLIVQQQDRFGGAGMLFLDVATLKQVDYEWKGRGDGAFLRASADGTTFAMRNGVGGEPHTVTTITLQGKQAVARESWGFGASILNPSFDGKFIYSASGVFNQDLKEVGPKPDGNRLASPYLPAAHGNYYLRLDPKGGEQHGGSVSFFLEGQSQAVGRLDGVEGVMSEQVNYGGLRDKLSHDQRVHFIPDAKLVVTIPGTNDQLILHRFDVEEALAKSGIDYLVVTSRPPATASRGSLYSYQLAVKSKKGGVKYRLDAGPEGMKVSPEGRLTWAVPRDFADREAVVILTVSDAPGQEIFHTFKINLVAAGKN